MKNIRLHRLTLENFKCHRFLNLEFGGRNASIYGANGLGKTSIYDALTWLLFGKNSKGDGEKNISIKPKDDMGNVMDHSAITSVEAEFLVDGEMVTFRRAYREVWSTKRGSAVETFDGNTSEYFVDGVPQKKYAYEERIRELVPEDTFRLLTSVRYFVQDLKWQDRRNVLFDMAGTLTDREIMARDDRFLPLSEGMGKLSMEDYRKKITAERKGFLGVKDETPARLNECQKAVKDLSGLNFDAARAAVAELEEKQSEIAAKLIATENDSAVEAKRLEIREARLALDQIEAENRAHRAAQSAAAPDLSVIQRQIVALGKRKASAQAMLYSAEKSIPVYAESINEYRQRWISVNGETFSGGNCPTCGQALPFEQLMAATAAFEEQKRQRLQEIERTAQSQTASKAQAEQRIRSLREEIAGYEAECQTLETELQQARASAVVPTDMEGYAQRKQAAQEQINGLNRQLMEMQTNMASVKNALRGELDVLRAQISENQKIISKEGMLEYYRTRMEQIRADAQSAAAALEAIDQVLFLMDEYTRFKTGFVEDSVNSLFRFTRFQLYREQNNGGVEDRCDAVVNGITYNDLNDASQVNAGIDIINALSRHYGVTVPLFVDKAESVTDLEESVAQMIRLEVSKNDKELRVEYEG